MSKEQGRTVPLARSRILITDFLEACASIPLTVVQKTMNVADLAQARQETAPRPSWCGIFTKAYAKVVAARPDLRRAFMTFPRRRLFEYAATSVDIVVEARLEDDVFLVMAPVKSPESKTILEIDRYLDACRQDPVKMVRKFQRALSYARLPLMVRRWLWWYALQVSNRQRVKHFGAFGVSSVGNWGVDSVRPIMPWTTTIHYGAVDSRGQVTMRLTFDHRVIDGSGVSSALNEMETMLHTEILAEVTGLAPARRLAA